MQLKAWQTNLVLSLLASPILAVRAGFRAARRMCFYWQSMQPSMTCKTCGGEISLVGLWRCGCGFSYAGHLLRFCPVCNSLPRMIRCFKCGCTQAVRI